MGTALAGYDVIVNAVLQDPNAPWMFIDQADLQRLRPGTLIVDVSCDRGMAFACAECDVPVVGLHRVGTVSTSRRLPPACGA